MTGRWRVFRHEAGLEAGPPAAAYVLLFAACLLLGHWGAATFKAVIVWPANGVLLAAYLQLPRRRAAIVLALCLALNLLSTSIRGDVQPFMWVNPLLNLGQVLIAGILARRLCGAALDMRRPRRMVLFALGAAVPAVAITTTIAVILAFLFRDYSPVRLLFTWRHLFMMEVLGLMIMTPILLLVAREHRFRGEAAPMSRVAAILALVTLAFFWVFTQPAPLLFMLFPVMMLAAYCLSPPWMAAALLCGVFISGLLTTAGYGPISASTVPDVEELAGLSIRLRQMPLYFGFLLLSALTTLPVSALMAERRQIAARLAHRTALALEQRRRAEMATAAKSRFLAVMGHEMRTPLNGISGYADLLSQRADLAPDAQGQIAAIREAGEVMLGLVEDVLDASRGDDSVRTEAFEVERLISDACAPAEAAARAKGLAFRVDYDGPAAAYRRGDQRRLVSALRHLLSNAVKFTDAGQVRIVVRLDGDDLTISVCDTGGGVDPGLKPRLFHIFVQGDDSLIRLHGGAGVGLPAARRNAQALGGDVVLTSTSPGGSVFTLSVRLAALTADEQAAIPLANDEETKADSVLRTLVVDDHPANRLMLRMMIEAAGSEAVEAVDGYDAIEKAADECFDLVLMDVRMPRMDGLEATRRIRRLPGMSRETVILAVTADAMPEDAARCLAAGMDGHLAKPVTHDRLYAAIDLAFRVAASNRAPVNAA